jgi:hypothetical protein
MNLLELILYLKFSAVFSDLKLYNGDFKQPILNKVGIYEIIIWDVSVHPWISQIIFVNNGILKAFFLIAPWLLAVPVF